VQTKRDSQAHGESVNGESDSAQGRYTLRPRN
jgi:hypothetical protein